MAGISQCALCRSHSFLHLGGLLVGPTAWTSLGCVLRYSCSVELNSSLAIGGVCIKDLTDKNQRPWTLILWFARLEKILKHFLHISGFLKWIEVL